MNLRAAAFFFMFMLCCSAGWGKVLVRGKIVGYDGKSKVYYHEVKEGIFTPYWKEIKPVNGAFRIEFENEGYGSMRVGYKNMYYRFFHDANSKIYFEIKEVPPGEKGRRIAGENIFSTYDSIKQISLLKISGDFKPINDFYNRNLRGSYFTTQMVDGNYYSTLLSHASSLSSALRLLDSLKQIEIKQIDQLPEVLNVENRNTEVKEKEIKAFLTNEVDAFYGAIFLNAMFLKRKAQIIQLMKDSTADRTIYTSEWELQIEKLNEQAKNNLMPTVSSPDYIDFMESMAYALSHYQQYEFPQNPSMSLDQMVTDRLFHYDTSLFRDEKSRFAYELSGLQLHLNDQLFYSPALLSSVYSLQEKYPTSTYFDFYRDKIEKLKTNLEVARQDFKKARIISANYSSFAKLIKRFEGKNLLVDIWATWCHPCIEEFQFKDVIQPLIDDGKIEVLYLSIDKSQWEDRWRQSIKINELQGSHYRADKEFIEDMWNVIGDYTGAIPRYVLIDKEGKMVRSTAARPSEGNELLKQIELLIGK